MLRCGVWAACLVAANGLLNGAGDAATAALAPGYVGEAAGILADRRQLFKIKLPTIKAPKFKAPKCGRCAEGQRAMAGITGGYPMCRCTACGPGMKWDGYRGCKACPANQYNDDSTPGTSCKGCPSDPSCGKGEYPTGGNCDARTGKPTTCKSCAAGKYSATGKKCQGCSNADCGKGRSRCGTCDARTGRGFTCSEDLSVCKLDGGASAGNTAAMGIETTFANFINPNKAAVHKFAAGSINTFNGYANKYTFGLYKKKDKVTPKPTTRSESVKRMELIESYMGTNTWARHMGDMGAICVGLMDKLHKKESVCGQRYSTDNETINCAKRKRGYTDKAYTAGDLVAVLDICVTPCMKDTTRCKSCCMVPEEVAGGFPCCRAKGCCPDQQGRRRRTQAALGPRQAQVSVTVAVSVEESSSSVSVYDALLRCLQNPAKLDAMCLTGSSGH